MKSPWPNVEEKRRFPVGNTYVNLTVLQKRYGYTSEITPGYPAVIRQNRVGIQKRVESFSYKQLSPPYGNWVVPQTSTPLNSEEFRAFQASTLASLDRDAWEKISTKKAELGLLLAERRKAAELIYQTGRSMEHVIRKYGIGQERVRKALKRQKPYSKKARRLSRKLASLQLAFSYGWAPLASDMYSIATSIGKGDLKMRSRVSTSSTKDIKTANITAETMSIVNLRLTYSLQLRVTDPMLLLASEFGLTNPASIAWELVPWSFAIDWIVPIKGFLDQFSALHGLEIVRSESSLTTKTTYTNKAYFKPYYQSVGYGGYSSEVYSNYSRQVGKTPSYQLPPIENPITSFRRALNQISLLIGFTRR